VGSFGEGHAAGNVEALEGILLREVDDADAAAVGLVGIGRPLEDGLYQGPGVDARLPGPGDDSLRRPLEVEAVMGGPMLGRSRVARRRYAPMEGDSPVVVVDLDGAEREGDVNLFARVGVGDRVEMPVFADLDVVVEADRGGLEAGVLVAHLGQGLQCRLVDGLEQLRAREGKPLEALRVVLVHELPDRGVEGV